MKDSAVAVRVGTIERKESQEPGESNSDVSTLAFATEIGQQGRVQRSSQIHHASSVSSLDLDQLERVQRSSQIEDATRQCCDPFPSIVPTYSVEDAFGKGSGQTVLSDELFSESSSGGAFEKTVLSDQRSSGFVSEQALALHADTREDYNVMAIAIISAQIPTRCGHSPVTHTDSESDGDSSDSVFYTRATKTSSSENTTSSPLGPTSSLFGSSTMTSTEMAPQVATEADFDADDSTKASDATNKVKADVAEDSKASDATNKDVADDTKASDATNKDQLADKASDKVVTDNQKSKADDATAKDATDHQKSKPADDDDQDQSWGSWNQWSWDKKQSGWQSKDQSQQGQQLSHNAKKKLNKEMTELVRPVRVGSLAYVLPDKAKKCCLTWRNAVEHHLSSIGKPPAW